MIEKNINEALVKGDAAALGLIGIIDEINKRKDIKKCAIYHHFPIYPNVDGDKAVEANILFISQNNGIAIFQCIDYSKRLKEEQIQNHKQNLDEVDRLIYAKIIKDAPALQQTRRSLKFEIEPTIYLHNYDGSGDDINIASITFVSTETEVENVILGNCTPITDGEYEELKATIEGSKGILKPAERRLKDKADFKNSKGAILTLIENHIYNFDKEQKRAALFTLDGAQRIRGLAGSGKTIILAMKAAQIHLQNPDATILYTYYTKTLHDLVKRLITRFYRQFAERDPNWDKIHIIHAWGGYGLEGVYSNACHYNNVPFINLTSAKKFSPEDPFDYVCRQLNENSLKKQYDYALLDEAQDFPQHFYRVCRQITRNNRVVWAYDDFQNILNVTLQSEKETFGKDQNGNWHIDFEGKNDELQDLILYKCYRNPRKILVAAFALGLGIYNEGNKSDDFKVLQRLENNEHWESLGFVVEQGTSKDGDLMLLSRPEENSSSLKNAYLNDDESIITIEGFLTLNEECEYVANRIMEDIKKELRPEDISVVCVDNRYAKDYFSVLSDFLNKKNINCFNLLTAPPETVIFKLSGHVTLSTIYKAKGNEAGSIYILGIDSIFSAKNDIIARNKIFTAMTRSLGWVTLTGMKSTVEICKREFEYLKSNGYKLRFKQPSELEVKTIRQNINNKQSALNKIERLADGLSKELGISKEEIVEELKNKIDRKKQI